MQAILLRMRWIILTITLGSAWHAGGVDQPATIPCVTISSCRQAPTLDGILTDACWQTAAAITNFHVFQQEGRTCAQTVRLTYDSQWLYVAAWVDHPNPQEIKPKNLEHDGAIARDDCVELFLDPGTDGALYFHYMVNAANARAEQRVTSAGGAERAWNMPWRSDVRTTDTGWNAELALPLAILAAYGDLAKIRMNACMMIINPVIDPQGIRVGENKQNLTWAPMRASFHEPEHFGSLAGLQPVKVNLPFLPALEGATVGTYELKAGAYNYPVCIKVRNYSMPSGRVNVVVHDRPPGVPASATNRLVELGAEEKLTLEIPVAVAALGDRAVAVSIENPDSGEVWQTETVANTSVLNLMEAYLDRNYYTTEHEAVAICHLGLPVENLKGLQLAVRDKDGRILNRRKGLDANTRISIPLSAWAPGTHVVSVELCRTNDACVCRCELELVKRPPSPGREWKIDRYQRILLNNGRPYFPFGVVFLATNEAAFKEIADAGFNSIMYWFKTDPAKAREPMDLARKYNLTMVVPLELFSQHHLTRIKVALIQGGADAQSDGLVKDFFKRQPDDIRAIKALSSAEKSKIFAEAYAANLDRILTGLRVIKDYDNLIGYNTFDEPFSSKYFDQWVQGLDLYRKTTAIDGYHPTYALAGPPEFDFCDIFGGDPYWIPPLQTPDYVVDYYHIFDKRAAPLHKPVWMVPMGEYWSGCHKRAILPQEQYCQTYLLLIQGARGLFYFIYPFLHQTSLDTLGKLAVEMRELGPVVTAPALLQTVTYSPGELDMEAKKHPDVLARLFAHPSGGYVLLAANSQNYPVDTKFKISLLGAAGSVGRLFASDTYSINNGAFSDRIEGFGVRAYMIGRQMTATSPGESQGKRQIDPAAGEMTESENQQSAINNHKSEIAITVTMQPHPELAQEEQAVPRRGREGRKNLAPNPSLEEASLPGWPDYYRVYSGQSLVRLRMGQPGVLYGLDSDNPHHGKVSLRLHGYRGNMVGYLAPKVEKPTEFVLSAYMRASRDGVKVSMNGGQIMPLKEFTLTTRWERYYIPGTLDPKTNVMSKYNTIVFSIQSPGEDDVWIDALQLEKGNVPTDFEP